MCRDCERTILVVWRLFLRTWRVGEKGALSQVYKDVWSMWFPYSPLHRGSGAWAWLSLTPTVTLTRLIRTDLLGYYRSYPVWENSDPSSEFDLPRLVLPVWSTRTLEAMFGGFLEVPHPR